MESLLCPCLSSYRQDDARTLQPKTVVSVERSPEEIFVDISNARALALFDMVFPLRLEKASALLSHEPTAPSAPCSDDTYAREGGEQEGQKLQILLF